MRARRCATIALILGAAALLPFAAAGAASATAQQDEPARGERRELKERFAERYQELVRAKRRGLLGETGEGLIAIVPPAEPPQEVRDLMEAENRDRQRLYDLLAEAIRADVNDPERDRITAAIVGRRNARRNFENARPEEWLLPADALWIQKKDLARHEALGELKKRGRVGETWEGYVAAVKPADADDPSVARLVEQENRWRKTRYEALAKQREVTPEQVATEQREKTFQAAAPGTFLRQQDERWARKEG